MLRNEVYRAGSRGSTVGFDAGLRTYLLGVFSYMAGGLVLSAAVAFVVANTVPLAALIFGTPLKWVAMFAPLAVLLVASFRFERMSVAGLQTFFWGFAALMGLSLASIFLTFTGISIVQALLGAAILFSTMALWGYTTKRDLTSWGSFLFVGLVAVILASIVNIFIGSSTLGMIVSAVGIVVFLGLTAWDMQRLRSAYYHSHGVALRKMQLIGALSLYLNFVNLFQLLLSLFGQRQEV